MGFLNFIEQYHLIGLPPYGLCQLSALVIAHISRRSADESAHAEFFLILTHVYAGHHGLVIEEIIGKSFCQFSLSHTSGTQENEASDGAFGVLQASPASSDRIAHGFYGFVLPDDTVVEFLFQMQQLVALALHHLAHRDARPAAYHIGNVFCGYLFFHHGFGALCLYKLVLHILDVLLQCLQFSVTDFCHTSIVAFPFGFFRLEFQILNLLLVLLYAVQQLFFALPFGLEVLFLFLQFGNVAVQLLQLFGIVLAFDGFALNLKLFQSSAYFIQLFRDRITLHTQLGGSFVHQVNGLVRKETLRDVAVAQFYGSYDGIVLDANSVMIFITLLQSAQDADAAQYVGLVHHYRLETAFKRLVLLKIFLILVQGGGANAS